MILFGTSAGAIGAILREQEPLDKGKCWNYQHTSTVNSRRLVG